MSHSVKNISSRVSPKSNPTTGIAHPKIDGAGIPFPDAFSTRACHTGEMRILVIGGSGFIGEEIVLRLLRAGHQVRVMGRGRRRPGVESVLGDVGDPAALQAACLGCDAVYYLAGIIAEVGSQTYERVHHVGVLNGLAAARAAGVRRWIQMSALGTRPHARARYHQTKWAAEEAVRQSGFDWTIFRPSMVFGRGDAFINFFERMSRWSPFLPLIGGGRTLFQPVAVEDVAHCFVDCLANPGTRGVTYDLCGRERWTLRAILAEVMKVSGRRRILMPVPWPIAWMQAWLMECIWAGVLRRRPPLNRDQLRMLREDNIGDPEPALRVFRLQPMDLATGIRRYLPVGVNRSGPDQGVAAGAGVDSV